MKKMFVALVVLFGMTGAIFAMDGGGIDPEILADLKKLDELVKGVELPDLSLIESDSTGADLVALGEGLEEAKWRAPEIRTEGFSIRERRNAAPFRSKDLCSKTLKILGKEKAKAVPTLVVPPTSGSSEPPAEASRGGRFRGAMRSLAGALRLRGRGRGPEAGSRVKGSVPDGKAQAAD